MSQESKGEEEEEEELEIERKARKLEAEQKRIAAESAAELEESIRGSIITLPSGQQMKKDVLNFDPALINARIESTVNVLNHFQEYREEGKSRKE